MRIIKTFILGIFFILSTISFSSNQEIIDSKGVSQFVLRKIDISTINRIALDQVNNSNVYELKIEWCDYNKNVYKVYLVKINDKIQLDLFKTWIIDKLSKYNILIIELHDNYINKLLYLGEEIEIFTFE